MNPSKFAELQVQMKQNQQELGDYLKDLDDWTKDIKKKEEEIMYQSPGSGPSTMPPVRNGAQRKASKEKEKAKQSQNGSTSQKRISSYDYRSWDRFDVDAALQSSSSSEEEEEQEEENIPKPPEPKAVNEALALKERGNQLFGQKKYTEAIECYSKALKIEPKNATFLSNRAICYLKLDKFEEAENDCSHALLSEPRNTKALFRRATARVGLSKLEEAKADFLAVLDLEPSNKLAQQEIDRLNESSRITKTVEMIVEQEAVSKIPEWFPIPPESAPDFAMMEVKSWKGKEPGGKMSQVPIRETANLSHLWQSKSPPLRPSSSQAKTEAPRFVYAPPPEEWLPIPEAPTTAFQFQTDLRATRSDRDRLYAYLKKVDPEMLPDLFGLSLDSSILSEIVDCFTGRDLDERTASFFQHLQHVNRYSTVALFLDSDLKPALEKLTNLAQKS